MTDCFKSLDENDSGSVSKSEFDEGGLRKIKRCIEARLGTLHSKQNTRNDSDHQAYL